MSREKQANVKGLLARTTGTAQDFSTQVKAGDPAKPDTSSAHCDPQNNDTGEAS